MQDAPGNLRAGEFPIGGRRRGRELVNPKGLHCADLGAGTATDGVWGPHDCTVWGGRGMSLRHKGP